MPEWWNHMNKRYERLTDALEMMILAKNRFIQGLSARSPHMDNG
jgi:hypothetical protein